MNGLIALIIIPIIGVGALYITPGKVLRTIPVIVTVLNLCVMVVFLLNRVRVAHKVTGASAWFIVDWLGLMITSVTLVVGFTAALYSVGYMRTHTEEMEAPIQNERPYFALFLAFYASLVMVPLMQNIFFTWGAIELTALTSVLLVDWNNTQLTHEAAWKYLVIMVSGGLIALLGIVILTGSVQTPVLAATWSHFRPIAATVPPVVQRVAFAMVLVGFGAKAGLVPFNFWLPDAHSQAPSPVSAMLSGVKLNCALYGILRMQSMLHAGGQGSFADVSLALVGILTVGLSTLMTVSQTDYKRLFAYSSAENLGLIALGFALGPIGTTAALLQMANHSIIKSMLFYHSGELLHTWGSTEMEGLSGMSSVLPHTGRSMMLGMLAIAGAPPFGLFISEFLILFAIIKHGILWLAIVLLVFLALLFGNFLRYAIRIGYGEPPTNLKPHSQRSEMAEILVPTSVHLALTLILGTLLPFVFEGLTRAAILD